MNRTVSVIFLLTLLLCPACADTQLHPTRDPNIFMKGNVPDEPRTGMTMRNVRLLWGEPDMVSGSNGAEVWYYQKNGAAGLKMNYELHFNGETVSGVSKRNLN